MTDVRELRELGEDGLAELLRLRPDTCVAPVPASLAELAERLATPASVVAALRRLDLPTIQVAEAIAALGGRAGQPELDRLLGVGSDGERHDGTAPDDRAGAHGTGGSDEHGGGRRVAVRRALDTLRRHGLLSPGKVPLLEPAATRAWPAPLGLGPPVAEALGFHTADELRALARNLGVPATGRKAEVHAAVAGALSDPQRVRAVVGGAPAAVRELLTKLAFTGEAVEDHAYFMGGYGQTRSPLEWAWARGLLTRTSGWGALLMVPAEVALALRGGDYTAPLDPHPPAVRWRPVAVETVARDAAATGSAFVGLVAALLHEAGRSPMATLRAGGVGMREQRRLASRLGCAAPQLRLALSLAYAAQVLAIADGHAVPTRGYDSWLHEEPSGRLAALLRAWWLLPEAPLAGEGTWNPAGASAGTTALRHALLREAADPQAGDPVAPPGPASAFTPDEAALYRRIAWRLPLGAGDPDTLTARASACWQEAALLGVVAAGAVSASGRALAGDGDLATVLADIGGIHREVRIQADLTAVVTGTPAADLAHLLDAAADQETRGTASTWRFTPASVRRALDAGQTDTALLDALAAVATGDLPQPLRYLIADVARRHGTVRVTSLACCLRSDDTALLAEIAADRRLRQLGLRLLAPTVLASDQPLPDTLAALRKTGYAPVAEGRDGAPIVERTTTHRAPAPRAGARAAKRRGGAPHRAGHVGSSAAAPSGSDAGTTLARALLAAADAAPVPSPTLRTVRAAASQLTDGETRILAYAIDEHRPVEIHYVNRDGNVSARIISDIELVGGSMSAWCHLREDTRWFNLGGVLTVEPADRAP